MTLKHSQKGFTVVELMIATAVFALLLTVVLASVTQIGRMYYKGITSARTQEAARTIVERVSQEIQYSGSDGWNAPQVKTSGTGVNALCVGNSRFFWVTNRVKDANNFGLWTDDSNSGSTACDPSIALPTAAPGAANPRDLLPDGMRIVKFTLTNDANGLYTVSLRVVYWTGDDADLDISVGGIPGTTCKGGSGNTFCSASELTTTVYKRL